MGDLVTVLAFLVGMIILVVAGYVIGVNHTIDYLFRVGVLDEEIYNELTSEDDT